MNTSFQKTEGSDEWYTPKEIIDSLGTFELDPCAPMKPLWPTAKVMWNKVNDGLSMDWGGQECGSIPLTHNRLSRSSAKGSRRTETELHYYSEGQETVSFRRSCLPMLMRCFSSANELSFTNQMAHKGRVVVAIPFFSHSGKTMPKPCSTAGWKVSMCH